MAKNSLDAKITKDKYVRKYNASKNFFGKTETDIEEPSNSIYPILIRLNTSNIRKIIL